MAAGLEKLERASVRAHPCPWDDDPAAGKLDLADMFPSPVSPREREIMNVCYRRAWKIVKARRSRIDARAAAVLAQRTLDETALSRISRVQILGAPLNPPHRRRVFHAEPQKKCHRWKSRVPLLQTAISRVFHGKTVQGDARNRIGSMGMPLRRVSKCRCGPVVNGPAPGVPGSPPEKPTISPRSTKVSSLAVMRERWP